MALGAVASIGVTGRAASSSPRAPASGLADSHEAPQIDATHATSIVTRMSRNAPSPRDALLQET